MPVTNSTQLMEDAAQEMIEAECRRIASALAVVDGQLLPSGTLLQDIAVSDSGSIDVELLYGPACAMQQSGDTPACMCSGLSQQAGKFQARATLQHCVVIVSGSAYCSMKPAIFKSLNSEMM